MSAPRHRRTTCPRHLRLRGVVAGVDAAFALAPGVNVIGAGGEVHVVLPERGVSRRHARIICEAGEARIEDLESKNGTFVNDRRVAVAPLSPGDELRLGRAVLRVEVVEESDAQLAIELSDVTPAPSPEPPETHSVRGDAAALWLSAMEAFVDRLGPPGADLGPALAALHGILGGSGVVLATWSGTCEPVVLAAAGEPVRLREVPGLAALARSSDSRPTGRRLDGAVVGAAGSPPLLLVAAGVAPDVAPLLALTARLLARLRPGSATADPLAPPVLDLPPGYVAGVAPATVALHGELRTLAQSDIPVLIVGETGAGKEHVARILHRSSPRRTGPFVAINCAALPGELLEAELFGIARGVATGVEEREGRFQQAHRGVLLLDEVADMAPGLQAKLLRALQEREVHPLGARRAVSVDVRVLASTNADPQRLVEDGRFRADLYYRLAGAVVRVAPLRERRGDIPLLVEHFIRRGAAERGVAVRGITERALACLVERPWPGNVRELEHEVRRLVERCPHGQAIDSTLLGPQTPAPAADEDLRLELRLAQLEGELILKALTATDGNRSAAARLLGVSRNGLALKIERLGLEVPDPGD